MPAAAARSLGALQPCAELINVLAPTEVTMFMSRVMLVPLATWLHWEFMSCPTASSIASALHQTSLESARKEELLSSQSKDFIAVCVKNCIDLYQ